MNIPGILKISKIKSEQSGFILPVLVITGVAIVLMIAAISSEAVTSHQTAAHGNFTINSQLAADAGLDDALNKMNTVSNWAGTTGQVTLLNDTPTSVKTTYEVSVVDGADTSHKTLTVTGRVFSPTTATSPKVTRKYNVDIQAVTSGNGPSSVSSGVGGLILNANAKISGGDVVVNGKITLSNNSQIGLSTNAVNVRVAHQSCPSPADSTYPLVCGTGNGEPISMGNTAKIYGNVQAKNQTTGKLEVQNSLGSTMPDVVVDGSEGLTLSNNATVVPNSSGTGIEFLTFWSAASCSPDCTSVTGTDLFTSQGTQTINLANNGAAPASILYAYWSKVTVSNNGAIGAVAGQTVLLSNNAVINFSSSVPGSDNRITTWVKRGYMRVYN
jgi:hypothetical protein